jgi:plasmid stability protein
MEEEVRAILRAAVDAEALRQPGPGTHIAGIGLRDNEEIPELRGFAAKPAAFD